MELGEEQQDIPGCIDGLEKFMVYVNRAVEEDGVCVCVCFSVWRLGKLGKLGKLGRLERFGKRV